MYLNQSGKASSGGKCFIYDKGFRSEYDADRRRVYVLRLGPRLDSSFILGEHANSNTNM